MWGGDIIKRRGDGKGKWDPSKDTPRGRIRIEIMRNQKGKRVGVKLMRVERTKKTYKAGERGL